MEKLKHLAISAAIGMAIAGGASAPAFAYSGQQLAQHAKITLSEARAIALKTVPGKITDQELEKEGGGSGLRYSFDVEYKGTTHEIGIDATTGTILENSTERSKSD